MPNLVDALTAVDGEPLPSADHVENVARLRTLRDEIAAQIRPLDKMPSTQTAKRDAISVLLDSLTGALSERTTVARKLLDRFDSVSLQHAGRIKAELESFVDSIAALQLDTETMCDRVERMQADHVRLVNQRVTE